MEFIWTQDREGATWGELTIKFGRSKYTMWLDKEEAVNIVDYAMSNINEVAKNIHEFEKLTKQNSLKFKSSKLEKNNVKS
jgi:hypothetical protein